MRLSQAPSGEPESSAECSICIGEYLEGESLTTLPCGHEFHTECIHRWLNSRCRPTLNPYLEHLSEGIYQEPQTSLTCPLCKRDIRGAGTVRSAGDAGAEARGRARSTESYSFERGVTTLSRLRGSTRPLPPPAGATSTGQPQQPDSVADGLTSVQASAQDAETSIEMQAAHVLERALGASPASPTRAGQIRPTGRVIV